MNSRHGAGVREDPHRKCSNGAQHGVVNVVSDSCIVNDDKPASGHATILSHLRQNYCSTRTLSQQTMRPHFCTGRAFFHSNRPKTQACTARVNQVLHHPARNRACITQLSAALFRQLGHPNPNHTAQNSHIHTQRREARVKPQTPVHDVIIWATDNIAHRAGACGERKQGRVLLTSVSCRSQTDTMPSNEANQTKLHQQCTHASHHILA